MRNKALYVFTVLVLYLLFSLTGVCFADRLAEEQQSISVSGNQDTYNFTVTRLKSPNTGEFIHTNKIKFLYIVRCEDDNANTIKTYDGSGIIPSGENEATVNTSEIIEEMKGQLEKYDPIYINLDITEAEDAFCISTEAITLTGKTLQDALASIPGLSSEDIGAINSLSSGTGESSVAGENEGTGESSDADEYEGTGESSDAGEEPDTHGRYLGIGFAVILIAGIIVTIVIILSNRKK